MAVYSLEASKHVLCFLPPPTKAAGGGDTEPKLPVQRVVPGVSRRAWGGEAEGKERNRSELERDGERAFELVEVFLPTSPWGQSRG